ncbi:hypothetical protein SD70_04335 [Gordoniibacillus kamchatkensis]|uniref:Uncharacterized protein n=1 Tax=Gordoniibacillus kamchatkensis TaxID=1590651 RepID=A0ABR5ALE0_9BACL|nr:DUF2161 family putative PD-(D/E)XK-type phosphodiesterase [Paenibacillus sp. VKM B-2647]KIL41849.1 hypothetical protein SD70_04335 [Paenibacillus sp. VKM B-2647]
MPIQSETELYEPIKQALERLGYEVKAEVNHCDVVAVRGDEPPLIVELKRSFNLPLLVQGIERQKLSDLVYVACEMPAKGRAPHGLAWSDLQRLCRMLGLGLITVQFYKRKKPAVDFLCHPEPYTPRHSKRGAQRLALEFRERSGDYNVGGSSQRKLVTAYREKSLHIAHLLRERGPLSPRELRELTGNPKAAAFLQDNYYRWFQRVSRGVYALAPEGQTALATYSHVVSELLRAKA